jgi:hypothetical protein
MIRLMHERTFRPIAAALVAALAAIGCEKPPVTWADPIAIDQAADAPRLVVDAQGRAKFMKDSLQSEQTTTPESPGLCRTSLVRAAGATRLFSAWWSVRRDSSAALYTSSSRDAGKTWAAPMPVAYSMIAPEGKGVFFAHTMGMMLHAPVPVIYGERLVSAAIAADSNRVLVAYEEPNGTRPQIDVALSVTQGHLFEVHTTASRSVDDASVPAVAFTGSMIAVSWLEKTVANPAGSRVVRVGQVE